MCDSFWGFLLYVCKANAIAEFLLPFRRHAEHTLPYIHKALKCLHEIFHMQKDTKN